MKGSQFFYWKRSAGRARTQSHKQRQRFPFGGSLLLYLRQLGGGGSVCKVLDDGVIHFSIIMTMNNCYETIYFHSLLTSYKEFLEHLTPAY